MLEGWRYNNAMEQLQTYQNLDAIKLYIVVCIERMAIQNYFLLMYKLVR